jgi:hypothetical protein
MTGHVNFAEAPFSNFLDLFKVGCVPFLHGHHRLFVSFRGLGLFFLFFIYRIFFTTTLLILGKVTNPKSLVADVFTPLLIFL